MKNRTTHQKSNKAWYIKSQNWSPTISILEKRISGNQRPCQSLSHVRDVYGRVRSLTGENTMVPQMKYVDLWNHEDKTNLREK